MSSLKYEKSEIISLKDHPEFNEKWVQDLIAENPSILGLGDLTLKSSERVHQKAGRLDLLLVDAQIGKRYEVEIQLGKTDESHIIRTIEYWDIERKQFPQYDHCAVIVAEEITGRFLNVIGLFNGKIPLVALQMTAVKIGEKFTLIFTKVLDEIQLGTEEDDDLPLANRDYWTAKSPVTLILADQILELINTFNSDINFKFNKGYITLCENNTVNRFVNFFPKKKHLVVTIRYPREDEIIEKLENSDLAFDQYNKRGRYRIIIREGDVERNKDILSWLLKLAYDNSEK